MKKAIWICLSLIVISYSIHGAKPTMEFASQPSGTAFSLPLTYGLNNLAPVPQNLCSATITNGSESATCIGLPVCKGSTSQTASFSCSVTTTCGSTAPVNNGSFCNVYLSVVKPSTVPSSTGFSFNLRYGSYNALLVSNSVMITGTNPLPPANSYRNITFRNSCTQNIWFGTITGAAPTKNVLSGGAIDCTGGDPGKQACVNAGGACYSQIGGADACLSQSCASDNDCVTGAACTSGGKCFWLNPVPANNSFLLTTAATNIVRIPEYTANGIGVVWSGAFGGRTGCTTSGCISALCTSGGENAQGVCSFGSGFQQPATQAEPTFITYPTGSSPTPSDAYDITLINGSNVPMSMYPTNEPPPTSGNPYTCGYAGYNLDVPITAPPGDTIGASSWELYSNQPNLAYRYVVPTTATLTRCAADTDCPSTEFCGLSYSTIGSTTTPGTGYLACGIFAGWFTADQICGTNSNFTTALDKNGTTIKDFQCNFGTGFGSMTMSNLYQCNSSYAVSCYSNASANCCGCVNWSTQGTPVLVPSNTAYVANCLAANVTWTGAFSSLNQPQVYDTILYLKQSCPSCYVYPFDDKSSSFTCTNGSPTTNNTEDYTVEFCPGGNGNINYQPPAH